MGLPREEYWSELPFSPPGYLPDPGIKPVSLTSPALAAGSSPLALLWPSIPGNKLTQKDNADSGVQFITPAGPRQSLLLAKDPNKFLRKPYIL